MTESPPAAVIDRLNKYHRGLAESEACLARSLLDQADIEAHRVLPVGDDYGQGLRFASDKNRVRSNRSDVKVKCLSLLHDLAYPRAPGRLHPNRPTNVFTRHMRSVDESPKLRLPP
ncbi:hypothetical protein [Methylobacterium sp. CM6247]